MIPEFRVVLVKEDICRSLSRLGELWARNSEAFKEGRCYEMWGISFYRRERTKFEFGVRREAEKVL